MDELGWWGQSKNKRHNWEGTSPASCHQLYLPIKPENFFDQTSLMEG